MVSRFLGVDPDQALPVLNITLKNSQHFPRVVAILMLAAVFYFAVEWTQSSRKARSMSWHSIRFFCTWLWVLASLWMSYPLVAQNTQFAAVSPSWFLGFTVIGLLLGAFTSTIISSALMIRSAEESKRLRLPRVPAATRAQFLVWIPIILLIMVAYYTLHAYSPPVIRGLAIVLVLASFVLMIGAEWASLCLARDENGVRLPYSKQIARLKGAYNSHDYAYFLIGHGESLIKGLGVSADDSAQTFQQAMQKNYAEGQPTTPINFHVRQLEEMQIQFCPKDGNPENQAPQNLEFKVRNNLGKNGNIRVLFVPDDIGQPEREVTISSVSVEKNAEEYIRANLDKQSLIPREIFSHAINNAVIQAIIEDSGPLLHRLVEAGQEDLVVELLKQKVDVNEKAEADWTALLYASAQGYPRLVRLLLDAGANPDIGNLKGMTPLIYGAHYGNEEICQILLEYGADVDAQDIHGMTALIIACQDGNYAIAKLLLDAGANSLIKNRDGKSALDFAYSNGHGQIAKLLKSTNKIQK
jgi:ankyrin repeat protein